MLQRIFLCSSIILSLLIVSFFVLKINSVKIHAIDNMPLVQNDPYSYLSKCLAPIEQRDAQHKKWLCAGLKIKVTNASGSGTIIYYDETDGYAYVQSCGHLWDGNMTSSQGVRKKIVCSVVTWYHNDTKLSSPATYPAEVLFYSNISGKDCSLLRFKPDWKPHYFPIAPEDFEFDNNTRFHSVGCDGGNEISHYDVRYVGMRGDQWPDLVTTENSPRPGRSGGGLMSEDFYIGICWGTTAFDGSGNGFFTPLKTIREINKENGYGWLNDVGFSLARKIPIIDRNNPQGKYLKDYIPLPN